MVLSVLPVLRACVARSGSITAVKFSSEPRRVVSARTCCGGHRWQACLGPGTGLGQVYAVWNEQAGSYTVCPSEGGMSDFVARTSDEWALRQFIAANAEAGHVDVEMVVSGEGISNIYKWLRSTAEPGSLNPEVDAAVLAAAEPAAVISQHGGGGGAAAAAAADPLCARAIGM
eukprot:SAG22_NODE_6513_length_845_cov_0.904826_1_plen_172_part_10